MRAVEQTTGEIARRLGITRHEPGLVLPFTIYSGFADARIIETLGVCAAGRLRHEMRRQPTA